MGKRPVVTESEHMTWRARVARLMERIGEHYREGTEDRREGRILRHALAAFLPLIEHEWWLSHPPLEIRGRSKKMLRRVDKARRRLRRRASRSPEALAQVGPQVCDALVIYLRRDDLEGARRSIAVLHVLLGESWRLF